MKREDFKEITKKHILACDRIIKENGKCADMVNCSDCPFYFKNAAYTDNVSDCIGYTGVFLIPIIPFVVLVHFLQEEYNLFL